MRTREEAIAALVKRSYVARARDWAMGESICVAKRLVEVDPGITALEPTGVWLYPLGEHRWASTGDWNGGACFRCLDDAVEYAIDCLEILDARFGKDM